MTEEIFKYISEGRTEVAISKLLDNTKNSPDFAQEYSNAVLLSAKFQNFQSEVTKGMNPSKSTLQEINFGILQLVNKIKLNKSNILVEERKNSIEILEKRDDAFSRGYEKWFELMKGSTEITIVNGIPRFLWDKVEQDVILKGEFQDILEDDKLKHINIIWDYPNLQAYRFYLLRLNDAYYSKDKHMSLNKHVLEKGSKPFRQLAQIANQSNKIELKALPFALSYTILKTDEFIFVVLLGARKGNLSPIIKIPVNSGVLYDHFSELLNFLSSSDLIQPIRTNLKGEIQMPELLQIVNKEGEFLTQLPKDFVEKYYRSETNFLTEDFAHRHVYCLVVSTEKRLLIQKRSSKIDNPNLWDKSIGGHVKVEETSVSACIRELKEELNIEFDSKRHDLIIIHEQAKPEFQERILRDPEEKILESKSYILFLLKNVDEKEVQLDNYEVKGITWQTLEEAMEFVNHNEVTHDLKLLLSNSDIVQSIQSKISKDN